MSVFFSPDRKQGNIRKEHSSGFLLVQQEQTGPSSPFSVVISSTAATNNRIHSHHDPSSTWQHLYVLPVLLFEFLAIALTRAVLPSLLLQKYKNRVYIVMGCADAVRGLLAFGACPLFGKLSDIIGRKVCLFITVLGTCAPVCVLAFFQWDDDASYGGTMPASSSSSTSGGTEDTSDETPWPLVYGSNHDDISSVQSRAIAIFVTLLALSGIFSSTFTLVFAYISDTVRQQEERVSAYGLALATFGLSFTIGPLVGGYLAKSHRQYVFLASFLLTAIDLIYIYFVLPESRSLEHRSLKSNISLITMDHSFSWNPVNTLRLLMLDPFLRQVGKVAFLYYTGLWAIISTLSVYAVKRFQLSPERLGELMSALGLCTMVAEAVLVRIMVPMLGEKRAMKVGLVSFALQCIVLGFAYESWHLFVCAVFSLAGNLVYPSLSSLVSGSVEPDAVGEALGAVNGIKALTEGLGPLVFGSLMTLSENTPLPGWPYLLAGILGLAAYQATERLPDQDDEYIHELEMKSRNHYNENEDPEQEGLLSEIEESEEDD